MRTQLTDLRNKMKEHGIDLYIIPTTDYHGSEYVNDYFKCREYISGFTGSAGTLVVTADFAGLWTDGRYFIQAAQQLEGSGIDLMKMGQPGVPTVEAYVLAQDSQWTIGFDGRVITEGFGKKLEAHFGSICDMDLVDEIWQERPQIVPSKIYPLPLEVTGETAQSKLKRLREAMGEADYILISRLEELAWLYNLRASDIAYTPVFYGFALISKTEDQLYVMDESFSNAKSYDAIYEDLAALENCSVMVDQGTLSYTLSKCFGDSVNVMMDKSPVELFKAVKNPVEIAATKKAHLKDGAAMAEFLCWLKTNVGKEVITEITAADYLEVCRRNHGARDLSFETIAGYQEHGAIVHYGATPESDVELKPEGLILVDSGGQYEDGTTDITRTIALGSIDDDKKQKYTAVLKGHIALALSEFEKGTTGAQLDKAARKPLHDLGLDFNHGTGHGVGHLLSVHEGPNTISPRAVNSQILPGMITSNEPGVYLEGRYGIRIENEILCVEKDGAYAFENITFCPYERDAIDKSMLTDTEIRYINEYHQAVYEQIYPLVKDDVRAWLEKACAAI